ncbi:DUF2849 domain-containing protein [Thioclava sp. 15-R06ZXC-3]|uniref:DUF2849 domain-containing protein n=1 Tax=Thioclava arctica TaxID=3238301 RepID=A0ABV3TMG3_9RHOB
MARAIPAQVVCANHLIEGDAIWFTGTGWCRSITKAQVAETPEAAQALLALAQAGAEDARAVSLYLAEVAITSAGPYPTHFREIYRVRGHKTHPQLHEVS